MCVGGGGVSRGEEEGEYKTVCTGMAEIRRAVFPAASTACKSVFRHGAGVKEDAFDSIGL